MSHHVFGAKACSSNSTNNEIEVWDILILSRGWDIGFLTAWKLGTESDNNKPSIFIENH